MKVKSVGHGSGLAMAVADSNRCIGSMNININSFTGSKVLMNDLLNKVKRADALIKLNLIQHYRCPPIAVHENQLTHLLLIV